MTKTERLFFHFLRNGLWGDGSAPGVPVDAGDWEAVFLLSCRQAVSGIVADGIAATAVRPAPGLWEEWVFHLLHIEMVNEGMERRGNSLVGFLASEGIRSSVFKGVSVARWYPRPLHRSYGDIDIVVHEGWNKLERLLQVNGVPYYHEDGDIVVERLDRLPLASGTVPGGKSAGTFGGQYRVEFHPVYEALYSPFMNSRLQRMASGTSVWWRDNVGKAHAPSETAEFYLACLILHVRRHVLSYGIGMKQVCDVAVMLRRAGVDLARLEAMLRHLGAWRFGRALFGFIDAYLAVGTPQSGPSRADKTTALLYHVFMHDGYVLKSQRESMGVGTRHAPVRVARNGWFWVKRGVRLFGLMPGEAFFFVLNKVASRLKDLLKAACCRPFHRAGRLDGRVLING